MTQGKSNHGGGNAHNMYKQGVQLLSSMPIEL